MKTNDSKEISTMKRNVLIQILFVSYMSTACLAVGGTVLSGVVTGASPSEILIGGFAAFFTVMISLLSFWIGYIIGIYA